MEGFEKLKLDFFYFFIYLIFFVYVHMWWGLGWPFKNHAVFHSILLEIALYINSMLIGTKVIKKLLRRLHVISDILCIFKFCLKFQLPPKILVHKLKS